VVYLYIIAGAVVGAPARYFVQTHLQESSGLLFPVGTLVVNLTGCLVIGLLAGAIQEYGLFTPEQRSLLLVGVLGSYTTFSSFSLDAVNLLRDGQVAEAALYTLASVAVGFVAVWLGLLAVEWVAGRG
jgi:CrcB protein